MHKVTLVYYSHKSQQDWSQAMKKLIWSVLYTQSSIIPSDSVFYILVSLCGSSIFKRAKIIQKTTKEDKNKKEL